MKKRILSVLLALAMICAIIPVQVLAGDDDFTVEFEFYSYTPAASSRDAGTVGTTKIDIENEKLEAGTSIVAVMKTKNLSKATAFGADMVSWDLIYDPQYLKVRGMNSGGTAWGPEGFNLSNEYTYYEGYSQDISDTKYPSSDLRWIIVSQIADSFEGEW